MTSADATERLISHVVLALICAVAVGCTESEPQVERDANLRLLSVYYNQYRAEHRGQVPVNESDFKNYIRVKGTEALSQAGAASVDELFISDRDGKPFAVKYRGAKNWPLPEAIAYEQEGSGGTRHVATVEGEYAEIPDEEFLAKQTASAAPR